MPKIKVSFHSDKKGFHLLYIPDLRLNRLKFRIRYYCYLNPFFIGLQTGGCDSGEETNMTNDTCTCYKSRLDLTRTCDLVLNLG